MDQGKELEMVTRTVKCADCGAVLDSENTPKKCPKCGSEAQLVDLLARDSLLVCLHEKVTIITIREFYEKNRSVLWGVIGVTVVSPFLGLVVIGWVGVIAGLVLGAISFFLSPFAVTKVREIKERST